MQLINQIQLVKNIYLSKIQNYPYKINFSTTSQCNSKCKTCNTWKIKKDVSKELTFDEIKQIFQNFPKTVSWMSFTGGEPFLRKDFEEILGLAVKQLQFFTISSNGLLTNKVLDILNTLPDFPMVINFSIDGPKEIHDNIRGFKGAFEKTWKTYLEALEIKKKRKNLWVGFETTISTLNIDYIKEFLKEKIFQGHKPTLTFAQEGNLYTNLGMKQISPKAHIQKIKDIKGIVENNLKPFCPTDYIEKTFLKNTIPFLEGKTKQPYKCVAGTRALSINPFGEVFPCLIWGKPLGDLRQNQYNIKKILKQPAIKEARKLIKAKQCPNCWTPCEAYQSIITDVLKINF